MEPAHSIITQLGGPTKVAAIVGVHRTRVSNWMRPKSKGGTGGTIPQNHIHAIMSAAYEAGIFLTGDDFLPRVEQGIRANPAKVSVAPVSGAGLLVPQSATQHTASGSRQDSQKLGGAE